MFHGDMSAMPLASFPPWAVAALFGTGLVAGFVDSIAGGGGLITLPVLLSLGFPPQLALGTNKLQASFGSGSASWHYARSRIVSLPECRRGALFTVLGAIAGTLLVQRLDPAVLKQVIPFLLLAIAGYVLFKPRLGAEDIHPRMTPGPFLISPPGCPLDSTTDFSAPASARFGAWPSCSVSVSISPRPRVTPRS